MRLNFNADLTDSTNILSIEVPAEMEQNISTGMPMIDMLMAGDGITPSTSCLLTGLPGAGKSTICLQLADSLTSMGHIAVYNGNEESIYQVRKKTRQLGLQHGFVISQEVDVWKLVAKLDRICEQNPGKTIFLFQDSLPTLEVPNYEIDEETNRPVVGENGEWVTSRGRPTQGDNAVVRCTEILTAWAKQTFGVAMMLGHVTKDGTFQGRQAIKHVIDAHIHLEFETNRRSENFGQRQIVILKNRFGNTAGMDMPFQIGDRGLRFLEGSEV